MDLPLGAPILAEDGKALGTLGGITIDPLSRTVKALVLFLDQALVVPAPVEVEAVREGRATTPSTAAAGIVRIQVPLALVRGVSGKTITLALDLSDLRQTLVAYPDVDSIAGVPLVLRARADGSLEAVAAALPDSFVPDAELDANTFVRDVYAKIGHWDEMRIDPFTHKLQSLKVVGTLTNDRTENRIPVHALGSIHRRFITVKLPLF
ncbi:MAG: hypothetical protein OXM03_13950 [Chloroflexota bacterium]|nr:hypothetical protein [Chloroflexota bacterium]MDE2841722.1 hypothetical protein [Chloroflexota bacterium]MDE2931440.1 hypothetical protein [Chloroflexota bacterium]